MKKKVSILGSTGSVGTQALEIISKFEEEFEIISLTGGLNEELLEEQINIFKPQFYFSLSEKIYSHGKRLSSLEEILKYDESDLIIIAISGISGIIPTVNATTQGRNIALANKESLVSAGDLIMDIAKSSGSEIIPLDSEHSAILQCMEGGVSKSSIDKIIITSSGGSLRDVLPNDLRNITLEKVLNHPNWSMGNKITIDSATLINKVFEVQEAVNLFKFPISDIEVIIHRESIIHGMIKFKDGNTKALLSLPDMKLPISYALFYPDRSIDINSGSLDFNSIKNLSFSQIDIDNLPWYKFGMDLMSKKGLYPAFLVGSDQAAVEMFMDGKVTYMEMLKVMKDSLNMFINKTENYDLDSAINTVEWSYRNTLERA